MQKKQSKKNSREVQHQARFGDFADCVISSIPLSCKNIDIGQTRRCINDRIREHLTCLNNGRGSNLAEHVRRICCSWDLNSVSLVGRGETTQEREIVEAHMICKHNEKGIKEHRLVTADRKGSFS